MLCSVLCSTNEVLVHTSVILYRYIVLRLRLREPSTVTEFLLCISSYWSYLLSMSNKYYTTVKSASIVYTVCICPC